MTRVVIIEKNGGPEVLQIRNIELQKLQPDQVLIETKAIGLNYIDTYHRSGSYPLPLPSGIGVEASGIIKKVGSKVKGVTKSKFLLISGKPIGEPIARGGPFVMNTKQEILQAVEDYNNGIFVQK